MPRGRVSRDAKAKAKAKAELERRLAEEQQRREEEHRRLYIEGLVQRYGQEGAQNVLASRLWLGAPRAAVIEIFGEPESTAEKVTTTSTVRTLRYFGVGNGFKLKVTVENDVVTGWDDSR